VLHPRPVFDRDRLATITAEARSERESARTSDWQEGEIAFSRVFDLRHAPDLQLGLPSTVADSSRAISLIFMRSAVYFPKDCMRWITSVVRSCFSFAYNSRISPLRSKM